MRSEARGRACSSNPTDPPMAEYLDRWVEDAARPSVSKSTYRSYRGVVDNHLAPVIGGIKLRQAFRGQRPIDAGRARAPGGVAPHPADVLRGVFAARSARRCAGG